MSHKKIVFIDGHPIKKYYAQAYPWAIKALKRDYFECRECGSDNSIIVHHKDKSRKNGLKNMNNNLDNLIVLCTNCHAEVHKIPVRWTKINADIILELRNQGKTFEFIGDHFGVSRQRIHQVLKKSKVAL